MKQPRWLVSSMLLTAMSLPAQTFGGARIVQSAQPVVSPSHYYVETAAKRTVPKRRSKKKSAMIVGGSALGGAAIGGLAGVKKGAAIGALAGGGGGLRQVDRGCVGGVEDAAGYDAEIDGRDNRQSQRQPH